ncbi:MAG: AAA family ATPase [Methylococcaceae bacterium]|nr:AAA family ATPase [Methylococcaceae bacterium]
MIIGILNRKGGVGKTSLSTNLASALCLSGSRILLVDADPQESALDWQASREGETLFPVVGMAKPTLHKDIPDLARNYDHILIDGPPGINDVTRSAMMACNLVVIPVQPSPYDVWAADETVKLFTEVTIYNDSLKGLFVINRKIKNTALGRDVSSALGDYPLTVAQTAITQRVVFAESAASGLSVLELAPQGPASHELNALVAEILSLQ